MHFFVVLLILLLVVLGTGMILGGVYLSSPPSSKAILNRIQFSKVSTSFGNGESQGELWSSSNSIQARVADLRTFLPLAEWVRGAPMPSPHLPLFFTLPEAATSVKTYLAGELGITFPGNNNTLSGYLISPTRMGLKFARDEEVSDISFTGNDVDLASPQELAMIIIYTID